MESWYEKSLLPVLGVIQRIEAAECAAVVKEGFPTASVPMCFHTNQSDRLHGLLLCNEFLDRDLLGFARFSVPMQDDHLIAVRVHRTGIADIFGAHNFRCGVFPFPGLSNENDRDLHLFGQEFEGECCLGNLFVYPLRTAKEVKIVEDDELDSIALDGFPDEMQYVFDLVMLVLTVKSSAAFKQPL